jgi:endonuclease/exonuclease/phosphatase family metal-dependent hydrolase
VHVSSSSFTVAFPRVAHAKTYRLYASAVRSNLFADNIPNAQSSAVSRTPRLTIHGLSGSSSEYYYRVKAMNGRRAKFSALIGEVGLRPAPPAHLRVTSNRAKTFVSWNGGAATGYQVEQATDPGMTANRKFYRVLGDANEFTPYGLAQGRNYYFRVRSMNGSTPSSFTGTTRTVVQSAQQPVRVMTYNIKEAYLDGQHEGGNVVAPWGARKAAQARLITRAAPDAIAIEEGAAQIGHRKHSPRQVDTLRKALGGAYALAHTEIPPGHPHFHRTGVYILYRKATWKAVGKGGHWGLGNHRWAAHQVLRNRQSGARFLFVATHLRPNPGRANDVLREHETEQLVQRGHQLAARKGIPVVYAGDFNSAPDRRHAFNAPAKVMHAHHIADAYNVAQSRQYAHFNTANGYARRPPRDGMRIDYVFAPQGVGVKSWRLVMRLRGGKFVGTIPSDHNPVVSEVMVPYHR